MSDVIQSVSHLLHSTWTGDKTGGAVLVELPSYTAEYLLISSKTSFKATRIERVQNPYTWACYTLRREEAVKRYSGVQEIEMWHATAPGYVASIAQDNFDWRRSNRAKFGQGVCFSPDATYANHYCTNGGALILCKVLVGHSMAGSEFTELPKPQLYDCTTGNGGKVYVKYCDNEFHPLYVVYYDYVKPTARRRWF